MRATMKVAVFITALVLASFGLVWGQAMVTLDSTTGLRPDGNIDNGAMLSFYIGFDNNFTGSVAQTGIANGFKITSPSGVSWGATTGEWNMFYPWNTWFQFGVNVVPNNVNGLSPDTIGFGGMTVMGGLPADFEGTAYSITIGPIDGEAGQTIILDSSYFPPMGKWAWTTYNPGWDGPHTFQIAPQLDSIWTRCDPQPTVLKNIELILEVQIIGDPNPGAIDLATIRVQDKIPPYQPATYDQSSGIVSTYCFIMRFLGSSGFRPVTGDFESTYNVWYERSDGFDTTLTGDFSLIVGPGNVLIDEATDINDVIFMVDYMFNGGPACPLPGLMDINKDGELSIRDIKALIDLVQVQ
jgi:hypothetical protein